MAPCVCVCLISLRCGLSLAFGIYPILCAYVHTVLQRNWCPNEFGGFGKFFLGNLATFLDAKRYFGGLYLKTKELPGAFNSDSARERERKKTETKNREVTVKKKDEIPPLLYSLFVVC